MSTVACVSRTNEEVIPSLHALHCGLLGPGTPVGQCSLTKQNKTSVNHAKFVKLEARSSRGTAPSPLLDLPLGSTVCRESISPGVQLGSHSSGRCVRERAPIRDVLRVNLCGRTKISWEWGTRAQVWFTWEALGVAPKRRVKRCVRCSVPVKCGVRFVDQKR